MKIGDKVSFLSEVGGGIVSGFQGNNIVLVEDEDGFEIPMRMNEVVVVSNENYDKPNPYAKKPSAPSKATVVVDDDEEEEVEIEPADLPIAYKAEPEERKGGDKLYAYLAFLPLNGKDMVNNRYAVFYINDSNYYQQFVISTRENNVCHLFKAALVEPNTKMLIDEIGKEDLNKIERILVQMISYKETKPFIRRPVVDVELRIDGRKFYKITSFKENDFFDDDALIVPIVEDDRTITEEPKHTAELELRLKKAMTEKKAATEKKATTPQTNSAAHSAVRFKEDINGKLIIVDLHAQEILDSTSGLEPIDILRYQTDFFNKIMKDYGSKAGQKIVFIHGKGEGVLRAAIINELTYRYKRCKYQDASFQEYGFGATMVTIRH